MSEGQLGAPTSDRVGAGAPFASRMKKLPLVNCDRYWQSAVTMVGASFAAVPS